MFGTGLCVKECPENKNDDIICMKPTGETGADAECG
jgi:hypothetical protein